jgi:hypothetical protein
LERTILANQERHLEGAVEKLCDDVNDPRRARLMKPLFKQIALAIVLVLALAYGYDYASVRRRMSARNPGDPIDVITHPNLLAIPQKGNKVEYALDAQSPMVSESCVRSLFPHYGYTPCWYVQRRAKTPRPMMILLPRH